MIILNTKSVGVVNLPLSIDSIRTTLKFWADRAESIFFFFFFDRISYGTSHFNLFLNRCNLGASCYKIQILEIYFGGKLL